MVKGTKHHDCVEGCIDEWKLVRVRTDETDPSRHISRAKVSDLQRLHVDVHIVNIRCQALRLRVTTSANLQHLSSRATAIRKLFLQHLLPDHVVVAIIVLLARLHPVFWYLIDAGAGYSKVDRSSIIVQPTHLL